jgi:hypothetical protein
MSVKAWLDKNPEWLLRSELTCYLHDKDTTRIVQSHDYGFLNSKGEFYRRLIDLPTFVNIKQVVKAKYLIKCTSITH